MLPGPGVKGELSVYLGRWPEVARRSTKSSNFGMFLNLGVGRCRVVPGRQRAGLVGVAGLGGVRGSNPGS